METEVDSDNIFVSEKDGTRQDVVDMERMGKTQQLRVSPRSLL
jgi:hypothetical protein